MIGKLRDVRSGAVDDAAAHLCSDASAEQKVMLKEIVRNGKITFLDAAADSVDDVEALFHARMFEAVVESADQQGVRDPILAPGPPCCSDSCASMLSSPLFYLSLAPPQPGGTQTPLRSL